MRYNRKLNFFVIFIVLGVIVSFAHNYNKYVKSAYEDASVGNGEIIRYYNNEIITKLLEQDSLEDWQAIVEEYEDLSVEIENSSNVVVTASVGKNFKDPAVRVRTPFEFHDDQVYILKSSMFVFKDYGEAFNGALANFMVIELLLALAFIGLFVFSMYNFMLKNYRLLYEAIEEYEKTGRLRQTNLKGYAGHIYKRFRSMTESVERQHKNQQNMIASISHDIKTPLTSIMGYAERLTKDNISEERRTRYLSTVYGKSLEIQELVDEFDEYISFNLLHEMDKDVMSADFLARRIKEEFGADVELSGIELKVRNRAGKAEISVNRKKFKRVFSNILANCEKHFVTDKKKIVVDIYCDELKVYIDISDNGRGVPQENHEVIFEPLYTSDEGRKVAGLGLAICREIIDSHGGKISARDSELGGLTICIELDRHDVPQYL